jgi:2-oxoglutarate dehydrogenase E2 component (dihydrolipoamide succinyltransferase)
MPTNVVMPQMGESIAEGTIVRWIKKIGDEVDRDEPLFEISTDKVDAEIPSPAAGVLTDIRVKEGETVAVNSVVAVIGGSSDPKGAPASAEPTVPEAAVGQSETAVTSRSDRGQTSAKPWPGRRAAAGKPQAEDEDHASAVAEHELEEEAEDAEPASKDDLRRQKSSPLVRRIAKEHHVDLRLIKGTGISGRVTKQDILGFIESGATASRTVPAAARKAPAGPVYGPGENESIVPMTVMRKKIAEHMVLSAHTSPHVYAVYEVNFGRVAALRERRKADYEAAGARLTYTAIIAKVIVDALREFPMVNASIDGDNIVYKKNINLGIAVALDNGLIVPVIKNADEKNLLGLSRAINDLAARARSKKLNPDEVQQGTFTITNPGIFGALYGLPLINQPQVGILGVGAIEKRPIVIDDAIAIRPVCHLTLGHDHRLIDGADAGRFLSFVKERLEKFEEGWL